MVTIDYTILGMLSWKPMTGYDMKRMMQDSQMCIRDRGKGCERPAPCSGRKAAVL